MQRVNNNKKNNVIGVKCDEGERSTGCQASLVESKYRNQQKTVFDQHVYAKKQIDCGYCIGFFLMLIKAAVLFSYVTDRYGCESPDQAVFPDTVSCESLFA